MSGPTSNDPNAKYFDTSTGTTNRSSINDALRQLGYDIPYSTADIYDLLGQLLAAGDHGVPGADFSGVLGQTDNPNSPYDTYGQLVHDLVAKLTGNLAGAGAKPSVVQGLSDQQAWSAYQQDALGPAPSQEYQNIFAEHFKPEGQGVSPLDTFVQKQEPVLQKQYLADAFTKFSAPGAMDAIKSDYVKLQQQADAQQRAGAGGSVPSFEDFIKQRVSSDYQGFLESQKPKLASAFELASPLDRYGYRQSQALEGTATPRIL